MISIQTRQPLASQAATGKLISQFVNNVRSALRDDSTDVQSRPAMAFALNNVSALDLGTITERWTFILGMQQVTH